MMGSSHPSSTPRLLDQLGDARKRVAEHGGREEPGARDDEQQQAEQRATARTPAPLRCRASWPQMRTMARTNSANKVLAPRSASTMMTSGAHGLGEAESWPNSASGVSVPAADESSTSACAGPIDAAEDLVHHERGRRQGDDDRVCHRRRQHADVVMRARLGRGTQNRYRLPKRYEPRARPPPSPLVSAPGDLPAPVYPGRALEVLRDRAGRDVFGHESRGFERRHVERERAAVAREHERARRARARARSMR